jgi:hypothetical protein
MADARPKKEFESAIPDSASNVHESHPLDAAIESSKANLEAKQKKDPRGRKPGGKNKPREVVARRVIVGSPEFNLQVQESKDMVGEVLNILPKTLAASTGCPDLELDKGEKELLGTEVAKVLAFYVPQMSEKQSVLFGAALAIASVSFNKTLIYMKHQEMQAAKKAVE